MRGPKLSVYPKGALLETYRRRLIALREDGYNDDFMAALEEVHRHLEKHDAALAGTAGQQNAARSFDLTGPMIRDLHEACGGDFDTELTVEQREPFKDAETGETMPAGVYATFTEYPEEGYLGPLGTASKPATPQPSAGGVELSDVERMHPRVAKLIRKGEPFFVVKASEPYAPEVVDLIRAHEGIKWTDEDEQWAQEALRLSDKPATPQPSAAPCRIYEYDGAFKCLTHNRQWGAISPATEPCPRWTADNGSVDKSSPDLVPAPDGSRVLVVNDEADKR